MGRLAGSGTHYKLALLDHDGKPTEYEFEFPSVTSIIDAVIAKPRLQHWFYSETVKGLSTVIGKYGAKTPSDEKSLKSLLKTEGQGPYAKRDAAGKKGTDVHEDLETLCAGGDIVETDENFGLGQWWMTKQLKPEDIIASEVPLVSFKHQYAGTVDLVYRDPKTGKLVLCDLKTSKYVFWTQFLQGQAYAEAWEELFGERPQVVSVLQVRPAGSGEGELMDGYQEFTDEEVSFDIFKNALDIYRMLPDNWLPNEME